MLNVGLREISGGGWFGASYEIRWKAEIALREMAHLGEGGEDNVSVYDLAWVTVTLTDHKGRSESLTYHAPICLHEAPSTLEHPEVWTCVEEVAARFA